MNKFISNKVLIFIKKNILTEEYKNKMFNMSRKGDAYITDETIILAELVYSNVHWIN